MFKFRESKTNKKEVQNNSSETVTMTQEELANAVSKGIQKQKEKTAGDTMALIAFILGIVGIFLYPIILIPLAFLLALIGLLLALGNGNIGGAVTNLVVGLIIAAEGYFVVLAVKTAINT